MRTVRRSWKSTLWCATKTARIYTVRYEAVNAMLVNEFLKEHNTVEDLKGTVAKQQCIILQQQREIEALAKRVDQVSAQSELSRPEPRWAANIE